MASQAVNCSAPDTGNMGARTRTILGSGVLLIHTILTEVLAKYGTPEQQRQWLEPLLDGKIRSAFAMTERFGMYPFAFRRPYHFADGSPVSSSDATNIRTSIKQDGNEIVINGRKWCVYCLDSPFTAEGYLSCVAGGSVGPETRGRKSTSSWARVILTIRMFTSNRAWFLSQPTPQA